MSGQFVWFLHDLVYQFDLYMNWYFGPMVMLVLPISAIVSYLRRSAKPVLISFAALLVLANLYMASRGFNIEGRLYNHEMRNAFK